MSEPLNRDDLAALKGRAHFHPSLPCSEWEPILDTALHYLDRVAELEKERDEAQRQLNVYLQIGAKLEARAVSAEAGLAAAEEDFTWIREVSEKRRGEIEWRGVYDCARDALARGGGQQDTGE